MAGLALVTKGKICPTRLLTGPSIGGIVYRDREVPTKGYKRQPTKQECETLYFPRVYTDLLDIIKEEEKKFSVIVTFVEAIG